MIVQGHCQIAPGILALDPATTCGFAFLDGDRVESGSYKSAVTDSDSWQDRLWRFDHWLTLLVGTPDGRFLRCVYEGASFGSQEYVYQHGMWAGVIEVVCAKASVKTFVVNPSTVKATCGYGRAKKDQVARACETLLNLRPADDNEADALFVLVHASHCVAKGIPLAAVAKRTRAPKKLRGAGAVAAQQILFEKKGGRRWKRGRSS